VATAAKKPVSKPVASSPKKPAAKAAAPAKEVSKAKSTPTPTRVKVAAPPVKLKAVAPIKTSAKPTPRKPKPEADVAPVSVPEKPLKTMKTAETKTPVAKPATKAGTTKSEKPAKASKKISGIPQNDAELMAMPESDYMNEAQLAYFKAKLTRMRDEILENARETGEHLKENEVFADPNDRATVEEENLLEQRVRDRERKLLKKINSSLIRIEEGEYGFCQETGDPIGIPRLLARPTAELSIEAQEKHERLEKLYAD